MTNAKPVLASTVREFFRADAKRMARLTETEAKAVAEGTRGALPASVVRKYNKGRKPERQYVSGATKAHAASVKAERASLVAQGLAGKRGPLPRSLKG